MSLYISKKYRTYLRGHILWWTVGRLREVVLAFSGLVTVTSLSTHSFSRPTTATLGVCSEEMQPSQFEIQREVENLRDIRRRSSAGGPGTLVLDPDLPNQSALGAAQLNYWDPTQAASGSNSSTEESGSSADDHDDGSDGGDPNSLFWVPARLHPEIDPAEFRAFIKEHARTPVDGSSPLERSFSTSSGGLGRKKSMLNREYKPSVNDGVENEGQVMPLRRNRTSYYNNPGPQLSISDLQKLDELAEEASQSDDPSKLRSVLRRTLSLNMSPSGAYFSPLLLATLSPFTHLPLYRLTKTLRYII